MKMEKKKQIENKRKDKLKENTKKKDEIVIHTGPEKIEDKEKQIEKQNIPTPPLQCSTEFSTGLMWKFLQTNEEILEFMGISSRIAQWAEDLISTNDIHLELAINSIPSIQKIKDKIEKMEDRFIDRIQQQINYFNQDIKNIKEFFSGIMGPLDEAEQILEDKISKYKSDKKPE